MRARHHTPLRASGLAFAAFLLSGPLAAQEIGDAAAKRSSEVSAEIDRLTQAQDFAGAGKVAEEASQSFSKDGEDYLAAAYALKAAQQDAYLGDWKRIDELYFPRFDALLKQLDAGDSSQGDAFIHLMEYAKAGLGDRAAQKKLAAAYVSCIEARLGADSQEALMAPIDAALVSIKTGDAEEGLRRAMPALDAVAASPFHKLTMARYSEVAAALIDVAKRLDLAEQLFQSGSETQAAQQIIPEAGDFYTAWARLEVQKGEFLRSYELFEAALRIVGQIDDWGKAMALNNEYGNTLNNTGATGKAIIFMEDAIEIAEKNLGEDNDMTLELYASFAEISRNFGAPAVAVQSDMAVYEKRTARYGEKDEKALAAANGLGQDHLILGDFDEARRYFALTRKLAGQQGEDRDNIVANADAWMLLTDSLATSGSPDKATAQRLLSIADDEDFAPVLRIRTAKRAAEGMKEAGDIDGAFALLKRTYQVSSQVFTGDHPLSFEIALRLADTVKDQDAQSALNIYDDLSEAMNRWIDEQNRLSNNTKVGELLRGHADALLADFAQFAETHDMAKASFFRAAYRWKTIVGGGMTAYRRLELQPSASDEKTESLIRNTLRLNAQMGAIMSSTPNDDTTGPMVRRYQETAQALMARLQQLGIEVRTDDSTFDVRPDLHDGDVLINYFITRRWGPDRLADDAIREQTLYAVVTGADGASDIVNLGNAENTDKIGTQTQIASLRGDRGAVPLLDVKQPFVDLYDQLLKPLEPKLKGAKTLYIVPDGDLFSVPFSMLRDAEGKVVEDKYALRILTSPDALIGANVEAKLDPKSKVLLVGDVDYRRGAENGAEPLPATGKEIASIARLVGGRGASVQSLTKAEATEPRLRDAIGTAKVAHLATHGAFGSQTSQGAAGVDTLWQSEILLAGAGDRNAQQRDGNDGRLYAFEVMDWDLSKLDLLVLSACETGRGDRSFITGLRGLPTALGIAGARRSLLTLWPVADEGTANFMIRYYEHLDDGQSYAEALRQTRREARDGKVASASDPRVWAAFVLFEG